MSMVEDLYGFEDLKRKDYVKKQYNNRFTVFRIIVQTHFPDSDDHALEKFPYQTYCLKAYEYYSHNNERVNNRLFKFA